jgi:hypothetical protein
MRCSHAAHPVRNQLARRAFPMIATIAPAGVMRRPDLYALAGLTTSW